MKKIFRKELLVGFLVVLALAILFLGINFLKGINIFKAANYYYVTYNNVEGLAVSAPVTLNGFKVGIVRSIDYMFDQPGTVAVEISVDKALKLPKGSEATVASDILGTASVTLSLGNGANGFYAVGDTIPGKVNAGMLAALSDNLMPAVNAIVPKVDTLLTSLNTLVANPSLTAAVNRFDDVTLELNASLMSLRKVMAQLEPVSRDIKSITGNVDSITGDLAHVSNSLHDVPVDSIVADLQSTIDNLNALTVKLNNPNSSLGKLTGDPTLYNNLNSAVGALDSLLVDVKRNPKRYISIKLL